MEKILNESPWMTIIDKADDTVEINIEGIIGGDFWDEDKEGVINTKEQMRSELKAIGQAQASKIIVNINSYGGDVNHGISIFDMLAQSKAEVTTRVNGFTASIATVIAMAGNKREISSNALFLIHKPSLMMLGGFNENELQKRIADLQKVDVRIRDIYEKRGVRKWVIDSLMEENDGSGKWLDADEAFEEKFIDHVYEPLKMAACVSSMDALNQLGISNIPNKYIDMNEETKTLKGMFDELKTFISSILKPETSEEVAAEEQEEIMVAPQEINDKLATMQEAIDAVELNDAVVAEVEALKGEKGDLEQSITTLQSENKTQKEKITELEGKLVKANGQSTTTEGPEGLEDPDAANLTTEQKALKNDLNSLRNQLTEVHN